MSTTGGGSGRRPHVLYVAMGFPPSRGSGVFRAVATAQGLLDAGCDVTVLTADRDFFLRFTGVDEALEASLDPRLEIVRVPLTLPRQEWDLRRWPAERVYSPNAWAARHLADTLARWPEPNYGHWADALVEAARGVHRRHRVDVTVATVNPYVDAYAAMRLKESSGVPFVLDQRDAWTLDQFTGDRKFAEDSDQVRWEGRLFEAADEVWLVNEAMREWHTEAYPSAGPRMRVVMNGWDPGAVHPAAPYAGRDPLRFGYLGTLTVQVPLDAFLEGWAAAQSDPRVAGSRAQLRGHLGFFRAPDRATATRLAAAADSGVEYLGPVARPDVAASYDEVDVLLMLLGGSRFVTSGKVFEYVATGLPVVSVTPPETGCREVLEQYPLWFPAASLEPADVADALGRAAEATRSSGAAERDAAVAVGAAFRRDRQMAAALEAVLALAAGKEPVR